MPHQYIPREQAYLLRQSGLTWQQVADRLNQEYKTVWQHNSVKLAVYDYLKGYTRKR
jgi:hypothetical protein